MNKIISRFSQYLCPAGNGVYTVYTAAGKKELLHQKIYKSSLPARVLNAWKSDLAQIKKTSALCLLGATCDNGGGILRGCNWGPLFLRHQLYTKKQKFLDLGDIRTVPHFLHDKYLNQQTLKNCQKALYPDTNQEEQQSLPVSPLSILEDFSAHFFHSTSNSLLTLGGDHSISYPLVREWIKAQQKKKKKVAVIHFDAHTDLLKTRLGVDICFGSWAYHCLDLLDSPSHFIQLGIRSSGREKQFWEKELGLKQFWAQEIREEGAASISQQIIQGLQRDCIERVYISFDIDVLDSCFASATGTPEINGLSPQICTEIIQSLDNHFEIHSADLVEVSPYLQTGLNSLPEPGTTLESAHLILESLIHAII